MACAHEFTTGLLRIAGGVRLMPEDIPPSRPHVWFANDSRHLNVATLRAGLPATGRTHVRPAAGRDYWEKICLRRWLPASVLHAVPIELVLTIVRRAGRVLAQPGGLP